MLADIVIVFIFFAGPIRGYSPGGRVNKFYSHGRRGNSHFGFGNPGLKLCPVIDETRLSLEELDMPDGNSPVTVRKKNVLDTLKCELSLIIMIGYLTNCIQIISGVKMSKETYKFKATKSKGPDNIHI